MNAYQPKTGAPCSCKRGVQRDNCPQCEGTGWRIDFRAIRNASAAHRNVAAFSAQWENEQGYKPATFQKAIAMQRLERGQSIREIIDALVAMRVD